MSKHPLASGFAHSIAALRIRPHPLAKPLQRLDVGTEIKPTPKDTARVEGRLAGGLVVVGVNAVGNGINVSDTADPTHRQPIGVRNDPDAVELRAVGSFVGALD